MISIKSLRVLISLALTTPILYGNADAQHAALATNPSGKPFFKSVALDSPQPRRMDFNLRTTGSVKGRVFDNEELAEAHSDGSYGLDGVKVTLRSLDKGFGNFAIEQYTDFDGAYAFRDLPAGNYTVEVDPKTLPTEFKKSPQPANVKIENPQKIAREGAVATPERVVMGTVFIDNDNDLQFKPGKDTPIVGAIISTNGSIAITDANGNYILQELPSGRIRMQVRSPKHSENTHVHFELNSSEMTRVVDVPLQR